MAASRETLNVFHLALPVLNTSQVVMLQRSLCPYMVMIMYFQWTLWTVQQDRADIYLYKGFQNHEICTKFVPLKREKIFKKTGTMTDKTVLWETGNLRLWLWTGIPRNGHNLLKVKTAALQIIFESQNCSTAKQHGHIDNSWTLETENISRWSISGRIKMTIWLN